MTRFLRPGAALVGGALVLGLLGPAAVAAPAPQQVGPDIVTGRVLVTWAPGPVPPSGAPSVSSMA